MNSIHFEWDDNKNKINKSLKVNYYKHGREWPYKNVKPRIIAEKYFEDNKTGDLSDYKFFCFDGKVIVDDNKDNNTVTNDKVEDANNQSAKPNNPKPSPIKMPFLKRKNRPNDRLNKKHNLQYKDLSE